MQEQWLALGGLFSSAFISSTIAPGGSEAVLAYMVKADQYDLAALLAIASIGNTLGSLTTWWLGTLAAKKKSAESLMSPSKQQALTWVRQYGHWSLLLAWLPLVGDGLCFAGGWLKLAFIPACIAILAGKTLRYTIVAAMFSP